MRTYRKLAEINFFHKYYESGILESTDLGFYKTPETEKLLANYRLMLKIKPGVIELIQECEEEEEGLEAFIEIDKELKFSIVIEQKNKQFFSFSELPFIDMGKEVFYFSNKIVKENKKSAGLVKGKEIGVSDLHWLLPKSVAKIENLDWKAPKTLSSITKDKNIVCTSLDDFAQIVPTLADGYYELISGKNTEASFVLFKAKYSAADIGLIEFFVDTVMAKAIHSEPVQFGITFEARKLPWQYQVFERFNSIKNILIVDDKEEVEFKELAVIEQDGIKSRVFISKKPIAITEITKKAFRIISPANGRAGKVWVEKLPIPKFSNITMSAEPDKTMFFKEYVYL
ncbi:MAG TPA: hypothetical protein DCQ31_04110 [Bacteroidales bacterium]|nr:hypothetical protein [Bacteroidales bacterium]